MRRLIVVGGCYRSGTTLVGEAFGRPEPNREPWPPFRDVDWRADPLVLQNPHHYEVDVAAGDGLPFLGWRLLERWRSENGPDEALAVPALVWVVRHPLDVIFSLREAVADGPDLWPPPDGDTWIERAANAWGQMNASALATPGEAQRLAGIGGWRVDVVRYETLAGDLRAAGYVDAGDRVEALWSNVRGEGEVAGQDYWHDLSPTPTGTPHVGRWAFESADEIDEALAALRPWRWIVDRAGYSQVVAGIDRS